MQYGSMPMRYGLIVHTDASTLLIGEAQIIRTVLVTRERIVDESTGYSETQLECCACV
jgi:hypothetical protein